MTIINQNKDKKWYIMGGYKDGISKATIGESD